MLLLFYTYVEFNNVLKVSSHGWIKEVVVDSKPWKIKFTEKADSD